MRKRCCKNATVIRERKRTSNPTPNPSHYPPKSFTMSCCNATFFLVFLFFPLNGRCGHKIKRSLQAGLPNPGYQGTYCCRPQQFNTTRSLVFCPHSLLTGMFFKHLLHPVESLPQHHWEGEGLHFWDSVWKKLHSFVYKNNFKCKVPCTDGWLVSGAEKKAPGLDSVAPLGGLTGQLGAIEVCVYMCV